MRVLPLSRFFPAVSILLLVVFTRAIAVETASDSGLVVAEQIPVASDHVRYTGRVLEADGRVILSWPGTEIRVRFRGSSLVLRGAVPEDQAWFNLRVDGAPRPRVDLDEGPFDVVLAEGLDPAKAHTVRLVRRSESWQGRVHLQAFVLPEGGTFLALPPARARRILSMGDSITCGASIELIPPYSPQDNTNSNAELTYAWDLAKRFEADLHLVSYGGRGIIQDWEGNRDTGRAFELFERTHAEEAEPAWDHARFTPDLVTICFGTNDYSGLNALLPRETFAEAYLSLVHRVHQVHPQAKVLLLSSPMLPGYAPERSAEVVAALEDVVSAIQAEGEDYARMHAFGDYSGTDWDSHPIAPQHHAMADELVPIIAAWMDWETASE